MRSNRVLIRVIPALAAALLAGACGGSDGGTAADASIDAPPGVCGAEALFTGAEINWFATDAVFCGVQGATWTVRGDATRTATTPPNGRFTLCVPHQAQTIVDITPPAAASGCLTSDPTHYPRAAVAIATDAVLVAGGELTARAMTQQQEDAMFAQVGQPYAAAQGQLVVHVEGTVHAVSISAAHAPAQQFTGSTWQAASDANAPVGSDVWFPNVAPGTVEITAQGDVTGTTTVSLEADRFTYVDLIGR